MPASACDPDAAADDVATLLLATDLSLYAPETVTPPRDETDEIWLIRLVAAELAIVTVTITLPALTDTVMSETAAPVRAATSLLI